MNFFAIYLSDKVSFNTTVRQILSRRRISLTWGEDRLNVVRDGLCALTFARVPLGLKILHVQTFQNYQSTVYNDFYNDLTKSEENFSVN